MDCAETPSILLLVGAQRSALETAVSQPRPARSLRSLRSRSHQLDSSEARSPARYVFNILCVLTIDITLTVVCVSMTIYSIWKLWKTHKPECMEAYTHGEGQYYTVIHEPERFGYQDDFHVWTPDHLKVRDNCFLVSEVLKNATYKHDTTWLASRDIPAWYFYQQFAQSMLGVALVSLAAEAVVVTIFAESQKLLVAVSTVVTLGTCDKVAKLIHIVRAQDVTTQCENAHNRLLELYSEKLVKVVPEGVMVVLEVSLFTLTRQMYQAGPNLKLDAVLDQLLVPLALLQGIHIAWGLAGYSLYCKPSAWCRVRGQLGIELVKTMADEDQWGEFLSYIRGPGLGIFLWYFAAQWSNVLVLVAASRVLLMFMDFTGNPLFLLFVLVAVRWGWQLLLLWTAAGCQGVFTQNWEWAHCIWKSLISTMTFVPWSVLCKKRKWYWVWWVDLVVSTLIAMFGNLMVFFFWLGYFGPLLITFPIIGLVCSVALPIGAIIFQAKYWSSTGAGRRGSSRGVFTGAPDSIMDDFFLDALRDRYCTQLTTAAQ